ncbi:MAG: tripartite tricarboxylate transporter TctB family protein [Silicimonas sp.]|nr:tripartite tricarboxylate transporter TctB family protein [Silicimonas sp.]
MTGDRVFGAVMIVLALGYILSATTIQVPLFPDPMGPKAFPYLIGAGVIVCGLIMVLRPDPEADWPAATALLSLAFATIVMVAYAYSLKPLGFLIPTAIASGILSYQLSPRPVPAVLTGLGLAVGLFVLFKYALGLGLVPFPKGWF